MRLMVTGRTGQVSRALQALAGPDLEVVTVGRPEVDLADPAALERAVTAVAPHVVASVGAYTAVDNAETDEETARRVNAIGPGALARACAAAGVPIVHLSTDYVFDGTKSLPYLESDPVSPVSVYGRTKAEGEALIGAAGGCHAVLRTAWVFDATGKNFLRTMLRLATVKPRVGVVDDQRGSPTYAPFIADAIVRAGRALGVEGGGAQSGVYHLTCRGHCTWREFAEAIFAGSAARGGPSVPVDAITTAQYPTPARRPANSVLDGGKLKATMGIAPPHWREGLDAALDLIAAGGWRVA